MGLWVERDKRTGEVVICSQASTAPGAAVRRIRLKPSAARALALRLTLASDGDAEELVEGTQEAVRLANNGVKVARDAHAFLKGVQGMFRED